VQTSISDDMPRIGLLEDDDDFREELALGLKGFGFHVAFAASDSTSFLRAFAGHGCDIAILDVNVPGEGGFAVATRLRAGHAVGIIMLTGRDALEDRVRGLEGGADVYVTKPVDLLELASIIRSLARRMRLSGLRRGDTGGAAVPAPRPGVLSTSRLPPWRRQICRDRYRPCPVPRVSRWGVPR